MEKTDFDLPGAASPSPMRARRRQSDAKWRASVATCYDALRHVVPQTNSLPKKKVSKALILEESEKHIQELENTIDHLLNVKCSSEGKTVLWKDKDYWTTCTLDHFREDFARQQHTIFHRSYPNRRCYSLLRDIQEEVFNMAPDSAKMCLINRHLLPPANKDTDGQDSGPKISVLSTNIFACETADDKSFVEQLRPNGDEGGGGLRFVNVKREHKPFQTSDCLQAEGNGPLVPEMVKEEKPNATLPTVRPVVPSAVRPQANSVEDRTTTTGFMSSFDISPSSSKTSTSSSIAPSFSLSSVVSHFDLPKESSTQEPPQTVPSFFSSFPEESLSLSLWANQNENEEGGTAPSAAAGDGCVKVESVSPIIHVPLLDDQYHAGTQDPDTNKNLAGEKLDADMGVYEYLLAGDSKELWHAENDDISERTPAILGDRDAPGFLTDGFKRKTSPCSHDDNQRTSPKCRKRLDMCYGIQPDATCPDKDVSQTNSHADSQVVPQVGDATHCAKRRGEVAGLIDIDSLLSSDPTFCQESQPDYDGFAYYYRQVSQKLNQSQNLGTTEIAAKVAHMWTKLSTQDKQTIKILASIENQEWDPSDQSSGHVGDLSQDLRDVDVMPLEIQDWLDNAP